MTTAELHEAAPVTVEMTLGLDGGRDADRRGTENDRMIRVHPS
jgi:hypothetical protein